MKSLGTSKQIYSKAKGAESKRMTWMFALWVDHKLHQTNPNEFRGIGTDNSVEDILNAVTANLKLNRRLFKCRNSELKLNIRPNLQTHLFAKTGLGNVEP